MTAPALADPGALALEGMKRASTFALHNGFGLEPTKYKKDNGTLVMEGVAVFRSGTFRDSMGYQNTWETLHMKQMVDNFDHLKNNKIFDDVPVRDGHPGWIISGIEGNGKVIGWHTSLRHEVMKAPHDDEEYDYLLADYEILDDDAKANIDKGLWRNRSSEIGTYLSNNEAEFWPVYMGVAYVDIPAVEGLNFSASKAGSPAPKVYVMFDGSKEKNVGETPPAAPQQGTQPTSTAPAAGPAQHGAPAAPAQPFSFSVNGSATTDFAAVQAHITALEQFRSETTDANRKNFVTALANASKIPATQLDGYLEYVKGLSPEQYDSWSKLMGDAEVPALLGQHAAPASNEGGTQPAQHGADTDSASEIIILREQVAMHKAAGTPSSAIEKMASYTRLKALDPAFKL